MFLLVVADVVDASMDGVVTGINLFGNGGG